MTNQIRRMTVPVPMSNARKSASTLPATVDARSGQSGKLLNIAAAPLLANHDEDEAHERRGRRDAAGADEVHRAPAVTSHGGIVVIAEEKKLIGRRADLSAGSLDDPE